MRSCGGPEAVFDRIRIDPADNVAVVADDGRLSGGSEVGGLTLAAGMNAHVFTTGRGTPYGLSEVPVVKIVTRTDLAHRRHDFVDVDAGGICQRSSACHLSII